MERILVIGCCGAGKSTLATELAERTGLPLVHLDKLYWRPNWQPVTAEEFDARLAEVLTGEKWILDGNFNRTLETRLERCDTVIWLDFPRYLCVWGVLSRVLRNYGKTRPDMGDGCPERLDPAFLKYVWQFPGKYREKYRVDVAKAENLLAARLRETTYQSGFMQGRGRYFAVTASDRFGNESVPAQEPRPEEALRHREDYLHIQPDGTIRFDNDNETTAVYVCSLTGEKIRIATHTDYIDVSMLPAGYYKLVRILRGNRNKTIGVFMK